jgi:hypothetical protein
VAFSAPVGAIKPFSKAESFDGHIPVNWKSLIWVIFLMNRASLILFIRASQEF